MKNVILGKTNIIVPQNGFGALPIQRVDLNTAVNILQKAYKNGMRFFDTAGNVSSEKMQRLWAKILSNEIENAGSFSLRAIETLKREFPELIKKEITVPTEENEIWEL